MYSGLLVYYGTGYLISTFTVLLGGSQLVHMLQMTKLYILKVCIYTFPSSFVTSVGGVAIKQVSSTTCKAY